MGFNWIDWVILAVVIYFIIDGWERGLVAQVGNLVSFLASLWFAVRFHGVVGAFFIEKFGIPVTWTNVLGYLTVAFVSQAILEFVTSYAVGKVPNKVHNSKVNRYLGSIASIASGIVIVTFFLLLIISFPVRGTIKHDITSSKIGSWLITLSNRFGGGVTTQLQGLAREASKFLTVQPGSKEQVFLDLPRFSSELPADVGGETAMAELVNQERAKVGAPLLTVVVQMTEVARAKSTDMFKNNYFAHTDLEGRTIADRMDEARITYQIVGENLAYAPDTQTAHQGLMDSPGHKANILDPKFHRIGIGVIDGGIYGKMYTQVFAD